MWDFNQPYFEGKRIPSDHAWRKLDEWRAAGKEIGVCDGSSGRCQDKRRECDRMRCRRLSH